MTRMVIEGVVQRPHPVNSPLTTAAIKGPLAGTVFGPCLVHRFLNGQEIWWQFAPKILGSEYAWTGWDG